MNITPITPQEVLEQLPKTVPTRLIEIINDLLIERFDGKKAEITIDMIKEQWPSTTQFKHDFLTNIERIYQKFGWKVQWIKESNAWETGYDRYEFTPIKNN